MARIQVLYSCFLGETAIKILKFFKMSSLLTHFSPRELRFSFTLEDILKLPGLEECRCHYSYNSMCLSHSKENPSIHHHWHTFFSSFNTLIFKLKTVGHISKQEMGSHFSAKNGIHFLNKSGTPRFWTGIFVNSLNDKISITLIKNMSGNQFEQNFDFVL